MHLSFLPGELQLIEKDDGSYVISIREKEICHTRSEKKAIIHFNKIRKEMESTFPPHEITREERTQLLLRYVAQLAKAPAGTREKKKKYVKGSTNTFG